MKRYFALVLAVVMVFALASCGSSGGRKGAGVTANTAVGDSVTMGGYNGEDLTWTAAAKGVGTVLLVSDKVFERKAFNEEPKRAESWKDSSLREWLGGEFFDTAFTDGEKALIATTSVKTSVFDFDSYTTSYEYSDDTVFLLSAEEFAKYVAPLGDFRYGVPTQAMLDGGIYMADVEGSETVKQACGWRLRDDGEQEHYNTMDVYGYDGSVSLYGNDKTNSGGVRPALWAYTDKELAEGWKAGAVGIPANEELDSKLASLSVGSTVEFGTLRFRDPSQGAKAVEWKVLDETDDAWLLYSAGLIGSYSFSDRDHEDEVKWATSPIREYINGDEFMDELFDPWERSKIKLTHVTTCGASEGWTVDPGPETDDHLFLLDREEILKYMPNDEDRLVPEQDSYWLRSPDFTERYFNCVNYLGAINETDAPSNLGLRIAMWVSK